MKREFIELCLRQTNFKIKMAKKFNLEYMLPLWRHEMNLLMREFEQALERNL